VAGRTNPQQFGYYIGVRIL